MKTNHRVLLLAPTILVCLNVCGWSSEPPASPVQDKTPDRVVPNRVVYDFKTVPKLPDIDAPSQQRIRDAVRRGVEFLLGNQNSNGSWGSATRTKGLNIYAPVPGAHHAFRAAVTSLCISALLEAAADNPQAMAAVARGESWLLAHLPRLRRATADALYNVWGHAYSIQALVRLVEQQPENKDRRRKITALIKEQFEMLTRYESVDGGWGYYDFRAGAQKPTSSSISFVNATALCAMAEANRIGIEPPPKIVRRAIAAIKRQQKPDFTYLYGEYLKNRPMRGINRAGGSLGRTQACNAALRMWGDEQITDVVIKTWLTRLYVRNGWLDIGRKRPVPHESWFQVAGYFYYYGHYYAAVCIDQLSITERSGYQQLLAKLMIDRQEKNGSWWDYPLYDYHQQYGTAFALMTLKRCLDPDADTGE